MVSGNDPLESFLNSFQLVKNVIAPLESGIRKAAKDFEHCWPGLKNGANNLELGMGQVNVVGDRKKKVGQCVVGDERKKGLSIKVSIKTFLGMFSQNCGRSAQCKVDASRKGVKERDNVNEDATCINCLQFAVSSQSNWKTKREGGESSFCSQSSGFCFFHFDLDLSNDPRASFFDESVC